MKKNIFLTGASSGIGLATAKVLLAAGHEVWGTSRDPARLPTLERLHPVTLDLSDTEAARESFQNALADAGHFDVLINNAGSGHFDPTETLPAKLVQEQFQILVFAQIELCRLALASMRKRDCGMIINVTSLASRLPVPFMGAYNAAKAAMASFTMTLQLELGASNIRVVDLQPADICTGFNDATTKGERDSRYEKNLTKTWAEVERNLKAAPKPELVARRILQILKQRNPPPRVTVGDRFQAGVAPLIFRFLPQCMRVWGLKKYYGI